MACVPETCNRMCSNLSYMTYSRQSCTAFTWIQAGACY